jgi:hypothetical protein
MPAALFPKLESGSSEALELVARLRAEFDALVANRDSTALLMKQARAHLRAAVLAYEELEGHYKRRLEGH